MEKKCRRNQENEKTMTREQFLSLTFHKRAIQAFFPAVVNAGFVWMPSHSQPFVVVWVTYQQSVMDVAPRVDAGVVLAVGLHTLGSSLHPLIGITHPSPPVWPRGHRTSASLQTASSCSHWLLRNNTGCGISDLITPWPWKQSLPPTGLRDFCFWQKIIFHSCHTTFQTADSPCGICSPSVHFFS